MKKINVLKEISLMVLILIFFSFSVYCLESNLNYIKFGGIFLLYICNYFFVNILKKVVEIGHKNIFELFLKLSVPFYSLKILLHETYRNLTNVMVIIISCGLIMILEKEFVKKCLSKEKLKKYCTLDNIKEFCIIVTPFYLLKTGDIKVIPILAIFLIYDLGLRKKKNFFRSKEYNYDCSRIIFYFSRNKLFKRI